jgi:hypothetical protein
VTVETEQMLAAKFEVLFPHLDERQRRLLMGAEARATGTTPCTPTAGRRYHRRQCQATNTQPNQR